MATIIDRITRNFQLFTEETSKALSKIQNELKDSKNDDIVQLAKDLEELSQMKNSGWNQQKLLTVLSLLRSENDKVIGEVTQYLKKTEFGWQEDNHYLTHNRCLQSSPHYCREPNNREWTEKAKEIYSSIFADKAYGAITSCLFAYSLTSLFVSVLNTDHLPLPLPLHIACKRDSGVWPLVELVTSICNPNFPIHSACPDRFKDISCSDIAMSYHLEGNIKKDLNYLKQQRDIPLAVAGFNWEDETGILLHRIANYATDTRPMGMKSQFEVLPIFVSESIPRPKSDQILSIDLMEMQVSLDYIEMLKKYQNYLGKRIFSLILDANNNWLRRAFEKTITLRNNNRRKIYLDIQILYNKLYNTLISNLSLTDREIRHISTLIFFLKALIPEESLIQETTSYLSNLHTTMHDGVTRILVEDQNIDDIRRRKIHIKGQRLLNDIVSCYESYAVKLKPVSAGHYKNNRYIFEVSILAGTMKEKVCTYQDDVRRVMGLPYFRVNTTENSIELIFSDEDIGEHNLQAILEDPSFKSNSAELPYAVGYDSFGDMVIEDIASFPHALLGGATNSGKSSALHSLLLSIVTHKPCDSVKLLLMDFGSSDLDMFQDTPHMLIPGKIITLNDEPQDHLAQLVTLIEDRETQRNNMNPKERQHKMDKWPSILCIIDEFPNLANSSSKGAAAIKSVQKILERGRKVKVHFILATQDATKSRIKFRPTNLSAKIAFRCSSISDSVAILGKGGAENLTGAGSMYLSTSNYDRRFVHGAYMPPEEIIDYLDQHVKTQKAGTFDEIVWSYDSETASAALVTAEPSAPVPKSWKGTTYDENRFREFCLDLRERLKSETNGNCTVSKNQTKEAYHAGGKLVSEWFDELTNNGVLRPAETTKPREIDPEALTQYIAQKWPADALKDTQECSEKNRELCSETCQSFESGSDNSTLASTEKIADLEEAIKTKQVIETENSIQRNEEQEYTVNDTKATKRSLERLEQYDTSSANSDSSTVATDTSQKELLPVYQADDSTLIKSNAEVLSSANSEAEETISTQSLTSSDNASIAESADTCVVSSMTETDASPSNQAAEKNNFACDVYLEEAHSKHISAEQLQKIATGQIGPSVGPKMKTRHLKRLKQLHPELSIDRENKVSELLPAGAIFIAVFDNSYKYCAELYTYKTELPDGLLDTLESFDIKGTSYYIIVASDALKYKIQLYFLEPPSE